MGRPGWTREQQAGIRFYTRITNILTLVFVVLFSTLAIATGRHRLWVVIGAVALFWACFTLFMKRTGKGQP
ncbi:hypothetical protein [Streptomyces spectabilis]|nr:hypothetical protein [Streptomyces spectabilis]MBB5102181.1 Flp pilus assembly protein protease CpaA [Streptomyces spectabilis]MCI3907229.1 hypothetical protein [Streptomyces spectabilis]